MKRWIARLKGGGKREILAPDENEAIKQLSAEKFLMLTLEEKEHTPMIIVGNKAIYSEDALYERYATKYPDRGVGFTDFIIDLVIKGGFKIA